MNTIVCVVVVSLTYPWIDDCGDTNALVNRIPPPHGYHRIPVADGSYAQWLRNIPLKPGNPPVMLYNGEDRAYQAGHHAVLNIDIGTQDLQQCADAIIRLYAEYWYSQQDHKNIVFLVTNGDTAAFVNWSAGFRPHVADNVITWQKDAPSDSSYNTFRQYLDFVFTYAGTYALSQQLIAVSNREEISIGDIFVQGGFPGHAVLVVDVAVNNETGEKVFLLCQSYMPAQDIHILKNLHNPELSPWYSLERTDTLHAPEWTFLKSDLKRF